MEKEAVFLPKIRRPNTKKTPCLMVEDGLHRVTDGLFLPIRWPTFAKNTASIKNI